MTAVQPLAGFALGNGELICERRGHWGALWPGELGQRRQVLAQRPGFRAPEWGEREVVPVPDVFKAPEGFLALSGSRVPEESADAEAHAIEEPGLLLLVSHTGPLHVSVVFRN